MSLEIRPSNRFSEQLRDKPQVDRVEHHANLQRPGAQIHPRALHSWERTGQQFGAWRSR